MEARSSSEGPDTCLQISRKGEGAALRYVSIGSLQRTGILAESRSDIVVAYEPGHSQTQRLPTMSKWLCRGYIKMRDIHVQLVCQEI